MSELAIVSTSEELTAAKHPQTAMVQNGACAHQNHPLSGATPDGTSTSAMVQPGALHHASEPPVITSEPSITNDVVVEVPDSADGTDVMHLSAKMHQALDLLFAGQSALSVARQLGVHRNTISRWKTNHAAFVAAYNRRRAEAADDLSRRITGLLDAALTNVERHVSTTRKATPEQIRASLRLISSLSRSRRVFATGPTDPFVVLDQMIRHDRYLSDSTVHTWIDDKTRASYINRYTMRLTDEAPDLDLPFAPAKRLPKGHPRELPTHPWDLKKEPRA